MTGAKRGQTAQILTAVDRIAAELVEMNQRLRRLELLLRPAGPHPSDAALLDKLEREAMAPPPAGKGSRR